MKNWSYAEAWMKQWRRWRSQQIMRKAEAKAEKPAKAG
jgi:hypothetical protein